MTDRSAADAEDLRARTEFNARLVEDFRANGGRVHGELADTTIILVHAIGARSGIEHVTPLACSPRPDGRYVIIASNGGSARHPAWYHNLRAHPRVTVEVGTRAFPVLAEELTGADREAMMSSLTAEWPILHQHQAKAPRQFPIFLLTPLASH